MSTVGVALSVFNGEATIDAALASIASQTRRPDAVVVVDDGSTDESAKRVAAWAQILPLTLLRHETNRGLAAGRTTGIHELDTDLVVALDADDVWLPHHLELMVRAHGRHGGVVSPCAVRWNPPTPIDWTQRFQHAPRQPDLAHLLVMNWLFSGSMFERTAFDAVGGTYRHHGCDDWDLWIRLAAAGAALTSLDVPTVLYRVHDGNMSGDDRLLGTEIEVLESVLAEHSEPSIIAAAQVGLRHRRARQSLRASYTAAADGRSWAARRSAVGALRGPRNVQALALAMAVAPRRAIAARDAMRKR